MPHHPTVLSRLGRTRRRPFSPLLISLSILMATLTWGSIIDLGRAKSPEPPELMGSGLALVETPNGRTIFAEIADTPQKRSRGLMFRTRMAPDRGMLFVFTEPGTHTFWMKNTRMALDMLWLDEKGTIVHIEHQVPICQREDNLCPRYRSTTKANFVLELGGGQTEKLGLKKGNRLSIHLPR